MTTLRSLLLLFLFIPTISLAAEDRPIRVTFINPASADHPFWNMNTQFMRAAARDLNIELTVLYSDSDRFKNRELALNTLIQRPKPDYLIFNYFFSQGIKILEAAEQAGVNTILINTDIPEREFQQSGEPQTRFRHWLARIIPDDFDAGRQQTEVLKQAAVARNLTDDSGVAQMIAISGMRDSTAAIARSEGLKQRVRADPTLRLRQLVYANWSEDVAASQAIALLGRYPQTHLIWAASDAMALAAANSIRVHQRRAGNDILLAGFDWSEEGIEAVDKGILYASTGGQFIGGALALVMAYDHAHGREIPATQRSVYRKLDVITQANLNHYRDFLQPQNWNDLDFLRLTRTHSEHEHYTTDTQGVMRILMSGTE